MQIVLRNVASSPATEIILPVDEDEDGPRYSEARAELIPQRRSEGSLSFSHQDPIKDFVWAQDDWSGGALQPYHRPSDPHRYAKSDNVDLRWEGVAALGMERTNTRADFLIRNADAERNTTTGWLATNGTLTTEAAAANTGTYGFRNVTTGGLASGSDIMRQELANPAVYRNFALEVGVRIRRTAGSESGIRLELFDGIVAATASATVTSATFTYVSASIIFGAGTSVVRISISTTANETVAHTYEIDDFVIKANSNEPPCLGTAEHNGSLYGVFGVTIAQWNETDDVWEAVFIQSVFPSGGPVHFNNNIFVPYGFSTSYRYGSGTTWTASTETAPDNKAGLFAVARNATGVDALWKTETATSVSNDIDGTNPGAAWTAPVTIGSSDRAITSLFGTFDSLQIGKEDGLWDYQRYFPGTNLADGTFRNLEPDFDVDVDSENFDKGLRWKGWLYLTTSRQGFIRWRPEQSQDIAGLFISPRLTDFGGRVRAMAASPKELFLLVDTPQTDSNTTKDTRLMSLQIDERGGLKRPHTLANVTIGSVNQLAVNGGFLYALGTTRDDDLAAEVAAIYRWELPSKTAAPFADDTPAIEKSGTWDLSLWHGDMPDTEKAFLAFTIWGEDLSSTRTIKVTYGLDGAANTTTTLTTFNGTGRVQTAYFNTVANPETNAIGRVIQMQLTLVTTDTTSPKVYATALHSTLKPRKVRVWEYFVRVETQGWLDTGYKNPDHISTLLSKLDTLEDQVYPIYYAENIPGEDGQFGETNRTVNIIDRARVSVEQGFEVHRLVLQEALTSS